MRAGGSFPPPRSTGDGARFELRGGGGGAGAGPGRCAGVAPLTGLSHLAETRPHGDVLRSGKIRLVPVADLRGLRGGCGTAPTPAPGPAGSPRPGACGRSGSPGPGRGPERGRAGCLCSGRGAAEEKGKRDFRWKNKQAEGGSGLAAVGRWGWCRCVCWLSPAARRGYASLVPPYTCLCGIGAH